MVFELKEKEYFERRFEDHRQLHNTERDANQRALSAALDVIEHRLNSLNELRSEVIHDRGQYLQVDTYGAKHEALETKISALAQELAKVKEEQSNQQGRQAAYAAGLTVFLVIVSIVSSIVVKLI